MESLEKKYYEASRFWEEGAFNDSGNVERIKTTIDIIPSDVKTLVDGGCGNGLFLNALSEKKPWIQCSGFDRSEIALTYVKCEKTIGDVANIHFGDNSFDCVTCLEVIEHLPVDVFDTALKELARVADKYLVISVPYKEILEENYTKCPQCKSVFNADLHLRSFDEEKMNSLLIPYGFKCVKHLLLGRSVRFKGHYSFRKLIYPEQFKQWKSPLYPICGFEGTTAPLVQSQNVIETSNRQPSKSSISFLTWLPKLFWPKEEKYYWILALYQKQD